MDIKNLLCNTTTSSSSNNNFNAMANNQEYEKRAFEYYYPSPTSSTSPTLPNSPSEWSSASSISSSSEALLLSPILSPTNKVTTTKQHHQTRTPWTSSEDYLLEKGYLQGLSWAMISSKYLPHRSRGCCWGRFKTLQTKSTEKKNWSESEDRVLIGAIKKHTRLFKQAWRSVALDLNDRDWRECEIRSARISGLLSANHQKKRSSS